MYRQQSLITLDQFYEMKPLTKLEAVLSFIDYSLFEEFFPYDSHRRGPKGYSKKQLFITLMAMPVEQLSDIKALVLRLKSDPILRRSLGYDYIENTPSEATLNRFITLLSGTDILERTFRKMVCKARKLGLIDPLMNMPFLNQRFPRLIHPFRTGAANLIPMETLSNGLDGKCML